MASVTTCQSSTGPLFAFSSLGILAALPRPYWKRLVRRAVDHSILQHSRDYQVARFYSLALEFCKQLGHIDFDFTDCRPLQPHLRFGCMQCRQSFRSKGGEGAHFFECIDKSLQFVAFLTLRNAQRA